jgi:hypothetical protein
VGIAHMVAGGYPIDAPKQEIESHQLKKGQFNFFMLQLIFNFFFAHSHSHFWAVSRIPSISFHKDDVVPLISLRCEILQWILLAFCSRAQICVVDIVFFLEIDSLHERYLKYL